MNSTHAHRRTGRGHWLLVAWTLFALLAACGSSTSDGGAGGSGGGAAAGQSGNAGTTGGAGTNGGAGVTGTGTAGRGGTTGTAGRGGTTGTAGRGGTTGTAGGGTTGSAGTTGAGGSGTQPIGAACVNSGMCSQADGPAVCCLQISTCVDATQCPGGNNFVSCATQPCAKAGWVCCNAGGMQFCTKQSACPP